MKRGFPKISHFISTAVYRKELIFSVSKIYLRYITGSNMIQYSLKCYIYILERIYENNKTILNTGEHN